MDIFVTSNKATSIDLFNFGNKNFHLGLYCALVLMHNKVPVIQLEGSKLFPLSFLSLGSSSPSKLRQPTRLVVYAPTQTSPDFGSLSPHLVVRVFHCLGLIQRFRHFLKPCWKRPYAWHDLVVRKLLCGPTICQLSAK